MTLNDAAQRLGVETRSRTEVDGYDVSPQRPALSIAHDVLAKLPHEHDEWELRYSIGFASWVWSGYGANGDGTFEQAVLALAARYLGSTP